MDRCTSQGCNTVKLAPKQLEEFRKAQARCRAKWGYLGMARIMENGVKEVGVLILPEIHEKISDNYTIAHGFRILCSGTDWDDVLNRAGI